MKLIILAVSLVLAFSVQALSQSQEKQCAVKGHVLDRLDARITEADIIFKGASIQKTVETDLQKGYELVLPHGLYEIYLKAGKYSALYYQRANIEIDCESELILNIYPFYKNVSYGTNAPIYQIESLSNVGKPDKRFNIVIAYLSKEKKNNTLIYKSSVLTFNNFTVSADKIIKDNKNELITAEGNVWIESGAERIRHPKISIKFVQSKIEIIPTQM